MRVPMHNVTQEKVVDLDTCVKKKNGGARKALETFLKEYCKI